MKKSERQTVIQSTIESSRRNFLKTAAIGGLGIAGMGLSIPESEGNIKKEKVRTREEKMKSMASNSYAVNQLFKRRISSQRPERVRI